MPEVDQTRLDLLKLQFQELTSSTKTYVDNLVKWFTFFCTVSIVVIGATIIKFKETDKRLIEAVIWVFLGVTVISIISTVITIFSLGNQHKKMKAVAKKINEVVNEETIAPPFGNFVFIGAPIGMTVSLIILLAFWIFALQIVGKLPPA